MYEVWRVGHWLLIISYLHSACLNISPVHGVEIQTNVQATSTATGSRCWQRHWIQGWRRGPGFPCGYWDEGRKSHRRRSKCKWRCCWQVRVDEMSIHLHTSGRCRYQVRNIWNLQLPARWCRRASRNVGLATEEAETKPEITRIYQFKFKNDMEQSYPQWTHKISQMRSEGFERFSSCFTDFSVLRHGPSGYCSLVSV